MQILGLMMRSFFSTWTQRIIGFQHRAFGMKEWASNSPLLDSTYRLQVLLLLKLERPSLDGNNLRRSVGIVGDRGAAFAAEKTVDGVSRGAFTAPFLDGAGDVDLVLGENDDKGWCVRVSR